MRQAIVKYKGEEAGILTQHDDGSFIYRYNDLWVADERKPAISLGLPKSRKAYSAEYLFPFFYNMLPEGANRQALCKYLRIDEDDHFGILLATARYDTIGAVTITKVGDQS